MFNATSNKSFAPQLRPQYNSKILLAVAGTGGGPSGKNCFVLIIASFGSNSCLISLISASFVKRSYMVNANASADRDGAKTSNKNQGLRKKRKLIEVTLKLVLALLNYYFTSLTNFQ